MPTLRSEKTPTVGGVRNSQKKKLKQMMTFIRAVLRNGDNSLNYKTTATDLIIGIRRCYEFVNSMIYFGFLAKTNGEIWCTPERSSIEMLGPTILKVEHARSLIGDAMDLPRNEEVILPFLEEECVRCVPGNHKLQSVDYAVLQQVLLLLVSSPRGEVVKEVCMRLIATAHGRFGRTKSNIHRRVYDHLTTLQILNIITEVKKPKGGTLIQLHRSLILPDDGATEAAEAGGSSDGGGGSSGRSLINANVRLSWEPVRQPRGIPTYIHGAAATPATAASAAAAAATAAAPVAASPVTRTPPRDPRRRAGGRQDSSSSISPPAVPTTLTAVQAASRRGRGGARGGALSSKTAVKKVPSRRRRNNTPITAPASPAPPPPTETKKRGRGRPRGKKNSNSSSSSSTSVTAATTSDPSAATTTAPAAAVAPRRRPGRPRKNAAPAAAAGAAAAPAAATAAVSETGGGDHKATTPKKKRKRGRAQEEEEEGAGGGGGATMMAPAEEGVGAGLFGDDGGMAAEERGGGGKRPRYDDPVEGFDAFGCGTTLEDDGAAWGDVAWDVDSTVFSSPEFESFDLGGEMETLRDSYGGDGGIDVCGKGGAGLEEEGDAMMMPMHFPNHNDSMSSSSPPSSSSSGGYDYNSFTSFTHEGDLEDERGVVSSTLRQPGGDFFAPLQELGSIDNNGALTHCWADFVG